MIQYKLNYFDFRGRGEIARLIFAAAGQKFEDHRIPREKWPEYKSKAPFGALPWLEIHDNNHITLLAQSPTIARYLARKFLLAGRNEIEAAELEMYADQIFDVQSALISAFLEKDPTRKQELQQKFFGETLPQNLKLFNDRVSRTGSGYFAASGVSWVDLLMMNTLDYLGDKKTEILAPFKLIQVLDNNVRAMPKIAAWISQRPKTEY